MLPSQSNAKTLYSRVFRQAKEALLLSLQELKKDDNSCPACDLDDTPLLAPSHPGCPYTNWRKHCIEQIQNGFGRQIVEQLNTIQSDRDRVTCKQTGVCCRLAHSEFDWAELKRQAEQGHAFAQDFTQVFLPYSSLTSAKEAYPDAVEQVLAFNGADKQPPFFYRCAYIGEDNCCTLFGTDKRPQFCSTYPETALGFVYRHCAWSTWQQASFEPTVRLHAAIEVSQWTIEQLEASLASFC